MTASRTSTAKHRDKSKAENYYKPNTEFVTKHDQDSGQVFREHEVLFNHKHNSDWIGELKTPTIVRWPRKNEKGARSLFDIAKIKCAKEFRNMSPEHCEQLPWSMAEKIWDQITSSHSESFYAWRTMAIAYGEDFASQDRRYQLQIRQPPLPLPQYYNGITSDCWATALRISPKQITIPDLVAIATITNLSVLDLSDGQMHVDNRSPPFDERVMRTWSELASSGRAFQHLRVLLLGWQELLDVWIFKYLDKFCTLSHVIITDCPRIHQKNRAEWEAVAADAGWDAQHAKRSAKSLRPLLEDRTFYIGAISKCHYFSLESSSGTAKNLDIKKPVLECWLGTPRPWSHIIEEFPGTRTIWLERSSTSLEVSTKILSEKIATDHIKRERDVERSIVAKLSPPAKRGTIHKKRALKAPAKSITDLLVELQR